jgi:hypothetical protein
MEQIKDAVLEVMRGLDQKRTGSASDNPEVFLRKVLTKKELSHIKFKYFKKGVLGLSVDSSAWLYSFNLQKEDLLSRLKECAGAVKEIKLRVGRVK